MHVIYKAECKENVREKVKLKIDAFFGCLKIVNRRFPNFFIYKKKCRQYFVGFFKIFSLLNKK